MWKTHSLLGPEMNPLNWWLSWCCCVIFECVFPFPDAVRDGGKLTILIMVSILLCVRHVLYNLVVLLKKKLKTVPPSPHQVPFSRKAAPESVVLCMFSSEELLFSVQNFISNSYAKRGQKMRHFSRYPWSYSWIMAYITSIVCPPNISEQTERQRRN